MDKWLGADIWEGNGTIQWEDFEGDFAIIRVNDMNGGHHKDTQFDTSWRECTVPKMLYFVYNPWDTGAENWAWLAQRIPEDAKAIMLDVEVTKDGYSPSEYAVQVQRFVDLAGQDYEICIYTGGGYAHLLDEWPASVPYVWAQYPYVTYPQPPEHWTWERIRHVASGLTYPYNYPKDNLIGWQFSGDTITTGGSGKAIDLVFWYGPLEDYFTLDVGSPPPPPPVRREHIKGNAYIEHGEWIDPDGLTCYYHATHIPKNEVASMFVTKSPLYPRTTSYVAETRGVDILSNGGEALYTSNPALPKGQSVSEGVPAPLAPEEHRFLSMQFDKSNNFLGFHVDKQPDCYWAVGINDILIMEGLIASYFDTEVRDPRSALFWNDTEWMLLHVDGRNGVDSMGIRLRHLALLGWEMGMKFGGNMDGGGSSTLTVLEFGKAIQKNIPPNGLQAALADHLGFKLKESVPMPDEEPHKYLAEVQVDSLGVFPFRAITPKVVDVIRQGEAVVGTLKISRNGKILMLETDGKYVPIRKPPYNPDGNYKKKWCTLELLPDAPIPEPTPTPDNVFTVPDTGVWVQALHDDQTEEWSYKSRVIKLNFKHGGLPETVPLTSHPEFHPLSEAWQAFCFEWLKIASKGTLTYDQLAEAWVSLIMDGRSHFDDHAPENGFTDYITGRNIGSSKGPIAIKTLGTGGNIYQVDQSGIWGTRYPIKTLNAKQPPPDPYKTFQNQAYIQWLTETTPIEEPYKRYRVGRFPQLKRYGIPFGTPLPIIGDGSVVYISRDRCARIENGKDYSPYHPNNA